MKRNLLLLLLALFSGWSYAQTYINVNVVQAPLLQADAGTDQLICPWDMAGLGGSPVALGGSPSYTYSWTGDSLSNAGIANPTASPSISGDYLIMVTDSLGCTAVDTVTITVDTCVGISDPSIPVEFTIFPNPNSGEFKAIAVGEFPSSPMTLKITSLNGQLVEERRVEVSNGNMEETFSLPLLSGGVYHVHLQVGQYQFVRKMVIQK